MSSVSAPSVNSLSTLDNVVLDLEHALTPSFLDQAENAVNGLRATAMLNSAHAALRSAQTAEKIGIATAQITEFFPILAKVYDNIALTQQRQVVVKNLQTIIAADLLVLRNMKLASHFATLAQLAADTLKEIPIPDDPRLKEIITTLQKGIKDLPKHNSIPITVEIANSETSSSDTSSISPTAKDEETAFQKDIDRLRLLLPSLEPPPNPTIFHLPESFQTVLQEKDNDFIYHNKLINTVWEEAATTPYPYKGTTIPIAPYGPDHRPFFLSRAKYGPVVWASTKKALARAMAERSYEGRTNDESD